MAEPKLTLIQKLLEIRKSIDYLQKKAEGAQFKYTSSSQVLASVREQMNEQGVVLTSAVTNARVDKYENKKGVMVIFTELDMVMTWHDAESDTIIELPWYGQGVDLAGEKGVGKAMTYAEKYFILKQFNIPTDKDDPDAFQEKHVSADELKKQQADRLASVLESVPKCVTAEKLTKLWQSNTDLQKNADFIKAVKAKGEALKKAESEEKNPKNEPAS